MPLIKLVVLALIFQVLNAEVHPGKVLFDSTTSCLECHNLSDFSNKNTKVKTFDTLHKRVKACTFVAKEPWFDDDILDVTKYLNKDFYKLKE